MSTFKKPIAKDYFFSKTDRRVLLKFTEKFYAHKIANFNFGLRFSKSNKTNLARFERRYRLEIRSIEHVLALLGSEFMSNVKNTNFRKTSEINARNHGLLSVERESSDN